MAERARLWEVEVDAGVRFSNLYSATTRSKARAEAWREAHDAWDIPFRDFLKIARVRAHGGPVPDAYAYVRRAYGVDVRIGERVSVRSMPDGEVIYPNARTTAHVHVLFDGNDFALRVHPSEIIQHAQAPTAPAPVLEPADAGEIPF